MARLVGVLAIMCGAAAAVPHTQDIARQPLPRIDSRSLGVRAQTYDQPAPGAFSPRNASYAIDVRLDHAARTLAGRETIRWRNISAAAATELQFHLYWNAWRNAGSTWLREQRLRGDRQTPAADAWGSIDVRAIRVRMPAPDSELPTPQAIDLTSQKRFIAPDDGNAADQTVMSVPLPGPVGPNESLEIEVEWVSKIPRPFARTGYIGDYYFIAHWFPKIGVLEDTGWNTHQFHSATEFYADYGVYDVRLTVPAGWIVGASGREVSTTDHADGTATHAYHGEDIHDFAWTTSPDFIDLRQTFRHPTLPEVEMRLLLRPEHAGQAERHFDATAACLRYYGEWFGAYPYGYVTIVDPAYQSDSGGMEYPTLFTAGTRWLAPRAVTQPEGVTVHEAGHQFWYGIIGNNEIEHAWMDEGLNTFSTARTIGQAFNPNYRVQRYFGGFLPWVFYDIPVKRETDGNRLSGYRDVADADVPGTPTWRYWPESAGAITYNKTALWLNTLEKHLGWPTLQKGMATYFDRWKFRHPKPDDFFEALAEASGQDLTWFFNEAYRSSKVFDYGLQDFTSEALDSEAGGGLYRTIVVARRFGEAVFPVDVVTTFRNGEQVRERWDGRDRRRIFAYERPQQALTAHVDPERVLLLDVNYTNNSWTLEPRTGDATLKWSLKWMVWLQDLMLTYAFFV
ncbi:MAG: M1 family metallopeptidase [Vicinamibacterales bacterium]